MDTVNQKVIKDIDNKLKNIITNMNDFTLKSKSLHEFIKKLAIRSNFSECIKLHNVEISKTIYKFEKLIDVIDKIDIDNMDDIKIGNIFNDINNINVKCDVILNSIANDMKRMRKIIKDGIPL